MLGKLIKYEFKSVNRLLIPLHLGLIGFTIIGRFYVQLVLKNDALISDNLWLGLANMTLLLFYILGLVAVGLTTSIYLSVLRPRKNLFTDEGYLMHTLPVSVHALIWSKLITAVIWIAIDTVLILLSVFTMLLNPEILTALFDEIPVIFASFKDTFGISLGTALAVYVPLFILSTLAVLIVTQMSLTIGHSFNTHKLLSSIGVYVGVVILQNILSTVLQALSGVVTSASSGLFFGPTALYNLSTPSVFWLSCAIAALQSAFTIGICYSLTVWFMTRKLNLE